VKRLAFIACLIAFGAAAQTIPSSPDQSQPSPAEQQDKRPAQTQAPSASPQAPTPKARQIVAPADEPRTSEQKANGESQYPEWLSKLFSDLKITDVVIAIFTGALAIYTARLWKSTEKLWDASERQAQLTRDLFNAEQRPWLKMQVRAGDPSFNEGILTIRFGVVVENIGKLPALDVANGLGALHLGRDGFEEYFDGVREFTEAQSRSKGSTLFPGEVDSWGFDINITPSVVEESIAQKGEVFHLVALSYKYRFGMADTIFETSRLYSFWPGDRGQPFPENLRRAENYPVVVALISEYVT
jgi:hypothetical protein